MTNADLDKFLDSKFEGKNYPRGWIFKGHFLRLAADVLYNQYQESLQYLNTHGKFAGGMKEGGCYSFNPEFSDANKDTIYKHMDNLTLKDAYLFIEACAIENGIKAILISQDKDFMKISREKEWPAGAHDLIMLFQEAQIAVNLEQAYVLRKLTDSVRWAGRYEYPLKREQLEFIDKPNGGRILSGYYCHGDKGIIDNIWNLLREMYYSSLKSIEN